MRGNTGKRSTYAQIRRSNHRSRCARRRLLQFHSQRSKFLRQVDSSFEPNGFTLKRPQYTASRQCMLITKKLEEAQKWRVSQESLIHKSEFFSWMRGRTNSLTFLNHYVYLYGNSPPDFPILPPKLLKVKYFDALNY